MKVLKFEIENYKALAGKHEILPEGSSFFLVGANGEGKTSAGRVLIDLLTKNYPSKPVTEGEHEGFVEITFDDGSQILAKYEDGKKPKMSFITSDGMKVATPKDFYEKMTGKGMTFSIDQFLSLAPKPRRAMLEQIVGVDLSRLNWAEESLMDDAKELRSKVKNQKARVKPFEAMLAREEVVDVKELSQKIADARAKNREQERLEQDITEMKERVVQARQRLEELESRLVDLEAKEIEVVDDFELSVWESDLDEAAEKNQKIQHAKLMLEEQQKVESFENDLKDVEEKIKETRQSKEDEIKKKPIPADGLEFDPDGDGLLLNGLPFEDAQIATSAKMIAGLQIAESQLGEIRYLHFDAAILDKENAMKVLEWAEKRDLQLCIERPLWDGGELTMEVWDKTGAKVKEVEV